jgi:hypothetical protein
MIIQASVLPNFVGNRKHHTILDKGFKKVPLHFLQSGSKLCLAPSPYFLFTEITNQKSVRVNQREILGNP